MDVLNEFLDELRKYKFIRDGLDAEVAYWGEDIPLMLLFSRVGLEIVENFHLISPKARANIFSIVENGVSAADPMLPDYVATGLLEAMEGAMIRAGGTLRSEMFHLLGKQSRNYLIEWQKWTEGEI